MIEQNICHSTQNAQ